MTRHQAPRKLRLIFHLHEPAASDEGIDIIVIPGVFDSYTTEKRKETCSWLKLLVAATTNDTRVYYYSLELEVSERRSLWEQLLDQGSYLLDALNAARQGPGEQSRPILFICHSLGGIVLKRALALAHQTLPIIERVTCGIIFLGTPHSIRVEDARWDQWCFMLKSNRRDVPRNSLSKSDIVRLAATCEKFENLHMQVPILSVYETRETKVRENLLLSLKSGGGRGLVLVDKQLACIGAKFETMIPSDTVHSELVHVPVRGQVFESIVEFLRAATTEGPENVALAIRPAARDDQMTVRTRSSRTSFLGANEFTNSVLTPTSTTSEQETRKEVQLPLYLTSAISHNPDFFGQSKVLKKLDDVLLPKEGRAERGLRSVALCGMGGMGKTEIVIEYVISRKDKFDAIFWLSADTTRKLAVGFTEISRRLGLEDTETGFRDETATREIVKGWLSWPRRVLSENESENDSVEAHWLLVFDNADEPDTLSDWWPVTGRGSVIVTSRDPIAKDAPYMTTAGIDLKPFSDGEGGQLLEKLSRRGNEPNSRETCEKISQTLGGLPLAISQMGNIIYRRHYSLKDFEESYEEDAKRLQEMSSSGNRMNYNQTVATVWAIDGLPPEATALLKVISFLDPDRIPEILLIDDAKNVGLGDYPTTKSAYFEARYELIRASLVTRNIDLAELRIHRLVQDVVRNRLELDEWSTVFGATVKLTSTVWPFTTFETRNKPERWPTYDSYLPHAARLRSLVKSKMRSSDIQPSLQAVELFDDAAWYMAERAAHDEIAAFAEIAWSILERLKVEDDMNLERRVVELRESSQLHLSIAAQGKVDGMVALDHAKKALTIVLESIDQWKNDADSLTLAMCYNNLGISYNMVGDTDDSLKSWELSYKAFRDREGAERLDPTWPAVSSAIVYSQQGKPNEGENLLFPIYEAFVEVRGRDDKTSSESGVILRGMGHVRIAEEKYTEGLDFHQRALANLRVTLGKSHYQTADCMYNVAQDLLRFRRTGEASKLLDEAIEAYGDSPYCKPTAGRALWRKGRLLRETGNELEAKGFLEKAMLIRHELVPDDDRDEAELEEKDWDNLIYYYSR